MIICIAVRAESMQYTYCDVSFIITCDPEVDAATARGKFSVGETSNVRLIHIVT